jgi:hypothetical protein
MANIRLKKTESTNRQIEVPEETPPTPKDEPFLDNSSEDELTRKRKMILTGITAGVGVAGATAAGLLFFGPYSPFGVKSSEKPDKLVTDQNVPLAPSEEKHKVQVSEPPVVVEQAQTVVATPPHHEKAKEVQKAPNHVIAVAPVNPPVKSTAKTKKETPVAIAPIEKAKMDSSGPLTYNYDIQDGGPVVEVPSKKKIMVSRDPDFNKIYLNGNSNNTGKYRISIPPPGDIYWKEEGKAAHKITVNPPTTSGIRADFPAQVKMTDILTWSATGKVSFYRVEVASDSDFLNRVKVFSTSKTSFPVENIGQGKWFLKISALNLQSGSWDSTKIFPITVGETIQHAPVSISPPEQAQDTPKEEIKDTSKEKTPVSENIIDSVSKPSEPVNPVEATVPDNQPVPSKSEE